MKAGPRKSFGKLLEAGRHPAGRSTNKAHSTEAPREGADGTGWSTQEGGALPAQPMNCPHHIQLQAEPRSYRDLRCACGGSAPCTALADRRSFVGHDCAALPSPLTTPTCSSTVEQIETEVGNNVDLGPWFVLQSLGLNDYRVRVLPLRESGHPAKYVRQRSTRKTGPNAPPRRAVREPQALTTSAEKGDGPAVPTGRKI